MCDAVAPNEGSATRHVGITRYITARSGVLLERVSFNDTLKYGHGGR